MQKISYQPWDQKPQRRRDTTPALAALIVLLIIGGLIMAVFFPPIESVKTGVPVSRKFSTLNYPAVVTQTIAQPGGRMPRPIGVVVAGDGSIIVSDADNHRVLILDPEGQRVNSFGTGTRARGSQGLNVPGGLALDAAGNIYVVDTLNGRIVKLSPQGEFIRDFASLADTAGSLA